MRWEWKSFLAGMVTAIGTVAGCASTPSFPWPYYATSMSGSCYDTGTLLGKLGSDGWPDLPLETCKPDPDPSPGSPSPAPSPIKLKCITVKVDDFYGIKADDIKCHSDLDTTQKALAQCQASCPGG